MKFFAAAVLLVVASAMDTSDQPGPDMTRVQSTETIHRRNMTADGRFGHVHPIMRPGERPVDIARDALRHEGLNPDQWDVQSNYADKRTGMNHIAFRQDIAHLMCENCIAVVNVDKHGRVFSLGYTAHVGADPSTTPTITARQALEFALKHWNATLPAEVVVTESSDEHAVFGALKGLSPRDTKVKLEVLATEKGEAALVWEVSIETEDPYYHMYEVAISAKNGEVLQLYDLVNWDHWGTPDPNSNRTALRGAPRAPPSASYTPPGRGQKETKRTGGTYDVYAIPYLDPTMGPRLVRDYDIDYRSSPIGWHNQGDQEFDDTHGNNVCAQDNPRGSTARTCDLNSITGGKRAEGGRQQNYVFNLDKSAQPTSGSTLDAAITNLFYWHNIVHDIFYLNGFDEVSGNFQENNFDLGGVGNDGVQANAQDGAGYNNANFATPRDGERPRCRMYLWNAFTPMKDGDFDSGIIIHEIGHGVSNRLTGGPTITGCLPGGQSGGMGEGWSDFWAISLQQQASFPTNIAFPMGDYVVSGGIRIYPYSYDMDINPATYGFIAGPAYSGVHAMGSFWAGALYDVLVLMKTEHGFDADWYDGTGGNNALWQDVLDGLKLQPCAPTMVDARDAILLADEQNYDGAYVCTMWCGFARRGLGVSASSSSYNNRDVVEAFDTPSNCNCPEVYTKLDALMKANPLNPAFSADHH